MEQPSQSGGPGLSGRSDGGAGPAGLYEILLDNWGYPAEGNLGYIKQGMPTTWSTLSQPVEEFLARAEAALEPYGTRLALRSTWAVLEGMRVPAARRPSCWSGMPSGSGWRRRRTVWRTCFPKQGLPEGEERLALLVEELDPDLDCSQGIWDPEA